MTKPILFIALLFPFMVMGQTDMFDDEQVTKTDQEVYADGVEEESKILIIPFEEKLFYSDIMRDLTTVNNMGANEIYHRLRNEIQLSMKKALNDSMETAMFLNTDSLLESDLVSIYAVLGYQYVPVPKELDEDKKGKKKTTKKKEPEPKKELGIRDGQVIAERQVEERYMNAKLKDNTILDQFYTNYGINKFLFINQMDVKMDLTDPEAAFIDPKRVVAIHYTIMDKDGKEISGGLASAQFPETESRLNYIIGGNFYKLSAEVLGSLVKAEKKEETEEKGNRKSKTKPE
jgi:hypothetical protein